MKRTIIFLTLISFGFLGCQNKTSNAQSESNDDKGVNINMQNLQTATFGSGCFWCTEAIFERLSGIVKVESGYSGWEVENPTY